MSWGRTFMANAKASIETLRWEKYKCKLFVTIQSRTIYLRVSNLVANKKMWHTINHFLFKQHVLNILKRQRIYSCQIFFYSNSILNPNSFFHFIHLFILFPASSLPLSYLFIPYKWAAIHTWVKHTYLRISVLHIDWVRSVSLPFWVKLASMT